MTNVLDNEYCMLYKSPCISDISCILDIMTLKISGDFGKSGDEFNTTWFDTQPYLKTSAFKSEFDCIINALRCDGPEPPFANRGNLDKYCATTPGKELTTRGSGYSIRTANYSYYFRCFPCLNDYDIYCYAFDNSYLLPELAGQHDLPDYCFSVLPSTGEMIRIVHGESGYYPCYSGGLSPKMVRSKVDYENGLLQITRAQEEAMLSGSLFGWSTAAAKPWNYDNYGRLCT